MRYFIVVLASCCLLFSGGAFADCQYQNGNYSVGSVIKQADNAFYTCKDKTWVKQEDTTKTIKIEAATFGHGAQRIDVASYFVSACNGKTDCTVRASIGTWGQDPARDLKKDIWVRWRCGGAVTEHAQAEESNFVIACR